VADQERKRLMALGENLAKYDIQPLWLSIQNDTDDQVTLIQIATDPDYYSPYEVSYRFAACFPLLQTERAINLVSDAIVTEVCNKCPNFTCGWYFDNLASGFQIFKGG
jgi:hypothetical protein